MTMVPGATSYPGTPCLVDVDRSALPAEDQHGGEAEERQCGGPATPGGVTGS
jgi:hypothetical protein